MNNESKIGTLAVGLLAAVALFAGVAALTRDSVSSTTLASEAETLRAYAQSVAFAAVAQVQNVALASAPAPKPGALSGPEIYNPWLAWGGIFTHNTGNALGSNVGATTTSPVFCSIEVPYGTSTLTHLSWRPDTLTGISTTATFDVGTSTLVTGTSSPALILAATISNTVVWSPISTTTSANIGSKILPLANYSGLANGTAASVYTFVNNSVAGKQYLNFRIASTSAGTEVIPSTMAGNCEAQWVQL